jgi:hypothetical protein
MPKARAPLEFFVDASQMTAYADRLSKWTAALPNAILQAINQTLPQGRRQTAKLLAGRDEGKGKYNVRQTDVIDKIKIHLAARTQDVYTGKLSIDPERRLGLNYFQPEQKPESQKGLPKNTKTSVSYQVFKKGGRTVIPNAFIRRKNGQTWIGINAKDYTGKKGKVVPSKTGKQRLVFLQGVSVWGMVAGLGNRAKIGEYMQQQYIKNVAKKVSFQEMERSNPNTKKRFDIDGYMMRGQKK